MALCRWQNIQGVNQELEGVADDACSPKLSRRLLSGQLITWDSEGATEGIHDHGVDSREVFDRGDHYRPPDGG